MILDKETVRYRRALAQIRAAVDNALMNFSDKRHILSLIDQALGRQPL